MHVRNPTMESVHFPRLHKALKHSAIKIFFEHLGGAERPCNVLDLYLIKAYQ